MSLSALTSFVRPAAARAMAAAAVLTLAACSPPEAPKLTPQAVQVVELTAQTLKLRLQLDAYNPNSFDMTVQSMTGHVTVNDKVNLGDAVVPTSVVLPSKAHTPIVADLQVPWQNAAELNLLAPPESLPYRVDGRVKVGSEKLNVELPFTQQGAFTRQQLISIGLKGLGGLLNGLR